MKYKTRHNTYKINIKYDDGSFIENTPIIKKLNWRYIYSNNSRFLPLYDCVYCGFGTNYNLCSHKTITIGFIQSSLWIYKIIKKYSIDECLIYGNRTYFLESLLYYKTKKIGFYPICIENNMKNTIF